jgi:hypothetical protein
MLPVVVSLGATVLAAVADHRDPARRRAIMVIQETIDILRAAYADPRSPLVEIGGDIDRAMSETVSAVLPLLGEDFSPFIQDNLVKRPAPGREGLSRSHVLWRRPFLRALLELEAVLCKHFPEAFPGADIRWEHVRTTGSNTDPLPFVSFDAPAVSLLTGEDRRMRWQPKSFHRIGQGMDSISAPDRFDEIPILQCTKESAHFVRLYDRESMTYHTCSLRELIEYGTWS